MTKLTWRKSLWIAALHGCAFLFLFHLGRVFGRSFEGSLWYPPAGLRLALLMIFGGRLAPWLAVAEVTVLYLYGHVFLPESRWAEPRYLPPVAVTALAYGLQVAILRRWSSFDAGLRRAKDVGWLVGAAVLMPLLTISVSRGMAVWMGNVEPVDFPLSVMTFWVGDTIGILMLTPTLLLAHRALFGPGLEDGSGLLLVQEPKQSFRRRLALDVLTIWAFLLLLHGLPQRIQEQTSHIHWYVAFLPILWISFRRGLGGSIVASLALTSGAAWMLRLQVESIRFYELQVLIILISASALLLGAVVSAQQAGERQLVAHNAELREVQTRLRANNAELGRRNDTLERFTFSVSHDLKSPLFTIQGYLGHLNRKLQRGDHAAAQADLQRIRRAAATLGTLLDGILETARAGREVKIKEQVSLDLVVRRAVAHLDGRLAERGVQVDIAPDLPTVQGDPLRLLQVFQNLIENAVKFMDEQPAPRIEIGRRNGSTESTFFVRDNGIGIPETYRDRIFGLFEQLDQKQGGTGLGLALAKRIVEEHGGRIWVESPREGKGTVFLFTLSSSP